MTADTKLALISYPKPLGELTEEQMKIILKEGPAYIRTPADLKECARGYTVMWTTGKVDQLNESPIGNLFAKLVKVYKLDDDFAYSLCEHYMKLKLYSAVANIE